MKTIKKRIAILTVAAFVITLIVGILPADYVHAESLSKKEKEYYSKILKEKQYIEDTDHGIYDGGSFLLYDINGDGRKELIVGGPLGLRSASFSIIYSFDGKNFYKSQTIAGEVSSVSPKGITFTYDDYTQAGLQRYHGVSTYKLDRNGTLTERLNEYLEIITNPDTLEQKTVEHSYHKISNRKEIKISRKTYTKAYKKYKFKTTGYNYSYEENGKTISHKYDIQLHEINNRNIKKYIK